MKRMAKSLRCRYIEAWTVFRLTFPTFLFWILVIVFVVMPFLVRAHDSKSHHLYHKFFEEWKDDKGHSCCNHMDCRVGHVRVNGEKVEALVEGEWVIVPPEKVRPYTLPSMEAAICHKGKQILCVSVGGGI